MPCDGVRIKLRKEECALDMGQSANVQQCTFSNTVEVRKSSYKRRSVHEAWCKTQTMQHRRIYKSCSKRRITGNLGQMYYTFNTE
jgi:hypothetical protein